MQPALFVLRYGVMACGVPIAVMTDLVYLTVGKHWPMFFSLLHVQQLAATILLLAPTVGVAAGRILVRRRTV